MRRQGFVKRTLALVVTATLMVPQSYTWGINPIEVKAATNTEVAETEVAETKIAQTEKIEYSVAPDYLYNFEPGTVSGSAITSATDSATIMGSGKVVVDAKRGQVFDNNSTGTPLLRTDYLSMPQVLEGAEEGFTVSMYIKSSGSADTYWSSIFNAYNGDQKFPLTQLGFNLIGRVNADGYVDTTDGSQNNETSYNLMNDGNWHQVAYAVKADEISVYCDGIEVSNVILDGTNGKSSGVLLNSLSQLTSVNVGGNCFWDDKDVNAFYDDIAIYHSYLTIDELQNNLVDPEYLYTFEEGTVSGKSVSNTIGNAMIVGAGQAVTDSERGQVFSNVANTTVPTGRQNYISLPNVLQNVTVDNGFTISAWVKKGGADLAYWGDVFAASNNGGNTMTKLGINMIARVNAVNGTDDLGEFVDLEDGSEFNSSSYSAVNDGGWHQIAYTVSNNMIAAYIDGEKIASKAIDATTAGASYGSFFEDIQTLNQISFGGNSLWGNPVPDPDINGYFDDITIYSQALTSKQLKENYAAQGGVIDEEEVIPTIQIKQEELSTLYSEVSKTRNSVHDPSIVVSTDRNGDNVYSVFGSHMGVSKTYDLKNWTSVTSESMESTLFGDSSGKVTSYENAFKQNRLTGPTTVYDAQNNPYTVDFGSYDMTEWLSDNTIGGNMWAPDVVYNSELGKWCMYLSLNGAKWNSSIILLTSDEEYGPYIYEAPIIFSGFSTSNSNKSFKDTDLEIALGTTLEELPQKYNKVSDGTWGEYLPHAIDPCVFYDEDGKLWLAYGSWSGGIYMLELDEKTGLRDYSVQYPNIQDGTKDVISDAYFGTKIAGGHYVSGEGAYIEKIGNYYFLFMSYGFYSPEGGYTMRIFRSEDPDGPYVDTSGTNAIYNKYVHNYDGTKDNRGMKLMGNYKWSTMSKGEVAQGHNSAFVDTDGKSYVVYHTKFDDGTAGHELRTHQLYLNEEGWIVAAPYEYAGETISATGYEKSDLVGAYELIIHDYKVNYGALETVKPANINLLEDGTITGDYEGTWTVSENTAYCNLLINGKTYKGVFAKQVIDGTNVETMCFTAVNEAGVSIWGSKYLADDVAVACNAQQISVPLGAFSSFTLPSKGSYKTKYKWESSNENVLANDGTVITPEEDTDVTLTMTIYKGDYYYTRDYTIKIYADRSESEEAFLIGSYFENNPRDLSTALDGSLYVRNPFNDKTNAGVNIANGITVEFDVKRTGVINTLGTIISMLGDNGRLFFTPGSYLGYNAAGSYFDANIKDFKMVNDYIGEEATVGIHINKSGFSVSVNGEEVYNEEILNTENGGGTIASYEDVLSWISTSADKLYFGYGSWWNAEGYDEANCTISNVKCYVEPVGDHVSDSIYEMDYSGITDATTKWQSEGNVAIKNNEQNGNYVEFTSSEAKAAYSQLPKYARVDKQYVAECDVALKTGNKVGTEVAILGTDKKYINDSVNDGIESGYILKLTKTKANTWKLNDKEEISLPDTWLHVTAVVSTSNSIAVVTISDADKTYYEGVVAINGSGTLDGYYLRSSGSEDTLLFDNIKVKNTGTHFTLKEAQLSTAESITYYDNPFYGKKLEVLDIAYTINWNEDSAKIGWDGLFAFYNTQNSGRVSFQSLPYLCFNGGGKWVDINNPDLPGVDNIAASLEKGKDYTFRYIITRDSLEIYLGDTLLTYVTNGEATLSDILDFISTCNKLTIGVGKGESAYWWTEKCVLKDIDMKNHVCKEYKSQIVKDATCTEAGIYANSVSSCGKSSVTAIEPIGEHSYGEWVIVEEPTYTKAGRKEKVCSICGEIISEIIPKLSGSNESDNNDNVLEDNDNESEKEENELKQTIVVTSDQSKSRAEIVVSKDKNGNILESLATIYVLDIQLANHMATVVVPEDLAKQIMKEVSSVTSWKIVIEEKLIESAASVVKKGNGTKVKVIVPANLNLEDPSIIISGKALQAAKKVKEKLVIQVKEGKNVTHTVTIPKAELKKAEGNLKDLNITIDTVKGDNNNMLLTFGEEGTLSIPVSIQFNVKTLLDINKKDSIYIYKKNEKTGKLEEVPNNKKKVSNTGFVTLSTLSGGKFILTTKKLEDAITLTDKVTIASSKNTVEVGKTLNLKAVLPAELELVTKFTSTDPCGKEEAKVTYTVDNKNIATISTNGKLKAKKAGKVTVTITILLENKQKRVIKKTIVVK